MYTSESVPVVSMAFQKEITILTGVPLEQNKIDLIRRL